MSQKSAPIEQIQSQPHVAIKYHQAADKSAADALIKTLIPELIAGSDLNRKLRDRGCAHIITGGFILHIQDRQTALDAGTSIHPNAQYLVIAIPNDHQDAKVFRLEMAMDDQLISLEHGKTTDAVPGGFTDFAGNTGQFLNNDVPFFRLRKSECGDAFPERRWVQSAFFSGNGRTVWIYQMCCEDGSAFPLCVEVYEVDLRNEYGIEFLPDLPIRWEFEFDAGWPPTDELLALGVKLCTMQDPATFTIDN